ncbi:CD1375 family protein [Secundilactobacillus oryzae]|nr:CD1375 family protein [Secundilactobacillus oryzae]
MNALAQLYANSIKAKQRKLEDVPERLREAVSKLV